MKVSSALEKFDGFIQEARERMNIDGLNRMREEMSEDEIEILEIFFEVFSGQINTHSLEEFLNEMGDARHVLSNIDNEGKVEWVSEDKMAELSEEYALEDYFSNNAAIIMECNDFNNQHVWFICLVKR